MNTIIFGAEEGVITVHNDNGGYAKVDAAGMRVDDIGLMIAEAILYTGGTSRDTFYNSSSIDFCDEEGFEFDEAIGFVSKALEILPEVEKWKINWSVHND